MEKMYHFNHQPEYWTIKDYAPVARKVAPRGLHEWGGGRVRRLLFAAYTISYLCLPRFDEALKIQAHDIRVLSDTSIELTLPFCKTSQFGGKSYQLWLSCSLCSHVCADIKPFVLHALPESMAALCPVRALTEWLHVSRIVDGYIFRRLSGDRVTVANTPMVSLSLI